jgi:cell division protein FtsW
LLLTPTALLTVIGLVMILSAGSISAVEGYGTSFWYFNRQSLYTLAGVVALIVTARVPYSFWRRAAIPMLLILLPVMLLTLHPTLGSSLYGASRWIDLGPVTLQPAEFAKLLTVCAAAAILSRKWKDLDRPREIFLPLGPLVLVVAGLVMLQKDLGTTLIICGSVFLLLFSSGIKLRYLVVTTLGGLGATAWFIFRTDYRKTRFFEAWLNWQMDPSGAGWQLRQGLIALGSGGWLGVGLGNSRQKWDYLPNAHSDFVFAVLGEELGLIGAIGVLTLFALFIYAGVRIAVNAPDAFGRLLAVGITGWIGLQTLVNLGAVTGLLPITGVPLPFLSFGGTALVVTLAGVGVVASVALGGVRAAGRRPGRERLRSQEGVGGR